MERNRVLISGLPGEDIVSCSDLMMYFQSKKKSGGGDVMEIQSMDQGRAIIIFQNEVVARNVLKRTHKFKDYVIQTSVPQKDDITDTSQKTIEDTDDDVTSEGSSDEDETGDPEELCTVQVNGISSITTQDSLRNYFENKKKSKGGPVKKVEVKNSLTDSNMATVVFRHQQDAKRVAEYQKHELENASLSASLIYSKPNARGKKTLYDKEKRETVDDTSIPLEFVISGISEITTEDSLTNYLENIRRSGGGDVETLTLDKDQKGVAEVKFKNVKNLDRLLSDNHRIDDSRLLIKAKEPEKAVPLDPFKIHVKGLNPATTEDALELYMEKMSNKHVETIQFGTYDNALISFTKAQDFDALKQSIENHKKGLEGYYPIPEPVPYCCCIQLSGLDDKTTEDAIKLYFDNPKKGCGAEPSRVDFQGQGSALVYFDDPSVIDQALCKRHVLDKAELKLEMFYPFLTEEVKPGKKLRKKTETTTVELDPVIVSHIMKYYTEELQELQDDTAMELEWAPDKTSAKMRENAAASNNNGPWMERVTFMQKFLDGFRCKKISVGPALWDEVLEDITKKLISTNAFTDVDITHDASAHEIRITGKKDCLQMAVNAVEMLIREIHEDKALQDSIETKVEKDLEAEKLALLRISDLHNNIQSTYQYVEVEINEEKGEVTLKGPQKDLNDISMEMYKFFSKINEEILELPERVLGVLETPKGEKFVCNFLSDNQVKAVVVHGQRKNKNEASIFAINKDQARKASKLIQSFSTETSLHLNEENIQVIKTPKWKDLVKDLEAQCKVNVVFEPQAQTLWISGIEPDASECFSVVEDCIEKNTILNNTVVIRDGCSKYIFQKLDKEIKDIEAEFGDAFLKIRPSNGGEIRFTGTRDGIEKGNDKLMSLVESVCDQEITIDKPGMKKLFKSNKGAKLIGSIELRNDCAVEIVDFDQLKGQEAGFDKEMGNFQNVASGEIVCGYTTTEGKKLVVYKDDLTKHRVDVIVNAANENLQHVGGLARAIVTEGGRAIQDECDRYMKSSDPILEGHVMVTDSGKLPCIKIIHAVGPRWESFSDYGEHKETKERRKERILQFTFDNCLDKARAYQSIAIPAVSSGIFGFPLDRCARILVETVIIFFQENPGCNLSEVHLTNNDDVTVKAFSDEIRRQFGEEASFFAKGNTNATHRPKTLSSLRSAPAPVSAPDFAAASSGKILSTPGGISISITVGDISHKKADVLVNTAGEDLDLQKNACARSFSSAAGPKLQTFCNRISPVQVGDIGVTKAGRLKCQYVFHAVSGGWESGKGEKVLRRILHKCLVEAERLGANSIAIPAIGTGVLRFPRNVVARISFEEVFSFSSKSQPSNLKEVKFVLYDKDKPTIQAFTDEIASTHSSSSFHTAVSPKRSAPTKSNTFSLKKRRENWFEVDMGELSVHVQSGDITQESTDALVVVSNPELDLEIGGGAGAAILKVGGPAIKKECLQHPTLKYGEVVVTTAGSLRVSQLIHCVPPQNNLNEAMLIKLVLDCLKCAEQHGLGSISFPAIGTGNLGVPPDICAKAMLMAMDRFTKGKPTTVQLVRVVIYQEPMVKDFYSKMKEFVGEMPDKNENPGMLRRLTNYIGLTERQEYKETEVEPYESAEIVLCVYSGHQTGLDAAVKAITEMVDENSKRQVIDNEDIVYMEPNHLRTVRTLQSRFDCKIEVEFKARRIIVYGSNEDVLSAIPAIYAILHEVSDRVKRLEQAELLAKDVQWEFEARSGFVPYAKESNAKIEYAYKNKKEDVTFEDDDGEKLKINFAHSTEHNSRGQTKVKRKCQNEISLPDYWDTQPKDKRSGKEETVYLVDLVSNKNTREYLKVSDLVKKTLPGANRIKEIQRVQNPGQYRMYAARKQKMDEENSKGSNEMLMFHGTLQERCESIHFTGFNRSYGQRNVYGHGVYFAVDASYSARSDFSPPDSQGNRYMYLARVLAGEYTLGDQSMGVPPPKDTSNPTVTYDTVVDDVSNSKIFVAFFDNQSYPEYLITFQ